MSWTIFWRKFPGKQCLHHNFLEVHIHPSDPFENDNIIHHFQSTRTFRNEKEEKKTHKPQDDLPEYPSFLYWYRSCEIGRAIIAPVKIRRVQRVYERVRYPYLRSAGIILPPPFYYAIITRSLPSREWNNYYFISLLQLEVSARRNSENRSTPTCNDESLLERSLTENTTV